MQSWLVDSVCATKEPELNPENAVQVVPSFSYSTGVPENPVQVCSVNRVPEPESRPVNQITLLGLVPPRNAVGIKPPEVSNRLAWSRVMLEIPDRYALLFLQITNGITPTISIWAKAEL